MRYRVSIEIGYAATGDLPQHSIDALAGALPGLVGDDRAVMAKFTVAAAPSRLTIAADLAGVDVRHLTSPLEALTLLDTALDQALIKTGLFEEFDVARKVLRAAPNS